MLKRRVAQLYDRSSRLYDRLYLYEQRRKHGIALSYLKPKRGDLALDVGCGTGLLLKDLVKLGCLAVGVDISKGMIKRARRRVSRSAYLVMADAEALPFKDGVFHEVFITTVLQNLPRPLEGLKEAYRVLRSEGRCFVSVPKKAKVSSKLKGLLRRAKLKVEELLDLEGDADIMASCIKKGV